MQARSTRGQNSAMKCLGLQGHQVNLDLKRQRESLGRTNSLQSILWDPRQCLQMQSPGALAHQGG